MARRAARRDEKPRPGHCRTGAGLRSLAEPVVDTTSDFAELVLAMLGVFAKLERRRIKERTARGRADAKANGVKFGRKPKLTPHQKREAIKRRDNPVSDITDLEALLIRAMGLHNKNQPKFKSAEKWKQVKRDDVKDFMAKIAN